jgi:hypothetical protein
MLDEVKTRCPYRSQQEERDGKDLKWTELLHWQGL